MPSYELPYRILPQHNHNNMGHSSQASPTDSRQKRVTVKKNKKRNASLEN
jgi:microcystin-dependent protein